MCCWLNDGFVRDCALSSLPYFASFLFIPNFIHSILLKFHTVKKYLESGGIAQWAETFVQAEDLSLSTHTCIKIQAWPLGHVTLVLWVLRQEDHWGLLGAVGSGKTVVQQTRAAHPASSRLRVYTGAHTHMQHASPAPSTKVFLKQKL